MTQATSSKVEPWHCSTVETNDSWRFLCLLYNLGSFMASQASLCASASAIRFSDSSFTLAFLPIIHTIKPPWHQISSHAYLVFSSSTLTQMKHACGNNYSTIPIMQSHIWCTQLFFRTWHFQILNCSSEVESSLKSTTICRSWPRVQQPLLESFPVRLRASLPALLAFSPSPLHVSSSPVPWYYLWRFARLGFTKTSCASAARRSSSRRRSASPKNKLRSNLRKPVSIKEKSMKKCLVLSMSNNADKLYSCTVFMVIRKKNTNMGEYAYV